MAQRNIEIVQTKIDIPTILVEHEGRMLPIHSKYNPIAEAERFIDSLADEIEKSDHLLFYGVGLGYHIKVAQERYPEKVFSVYEPVEQVSDQFVGLAGTTGVKLNELAKNYVELSTDSIIPNIADFSIYFAHRILLITLPIYEKLVPNEIQQFNDTYKKIYKEKVGNKQTDKKFSELWAINMMVNVKHTFNTPNLLMQDNNPFEGKPVILAAAGPSLSDEIENLKHIKERGLAYIFAVGSANKALLKHNVMPDAVLSYDPQGTNWHVFEEMMEQNIDSIPLIFGTTVGHETVDYYPGPKTHVVISKDTLTPYLHDAEMITVNDSSTISNVTFQILRKLNVSKIILVGQNFSYRDNQFYASGIKRYDELTKQLTDGKLKDVEIEKSFYVEDVYGNEVRTNLTFDTMRKEMEFYLSVHQDLGVVNTTKDGAKIAGAPFVNLDELLEQELIKPVVQNGWYEQLHLPKTQLQQKKLTKLENENKKFMELFEVAQMGFESLKEQAHLKDIQKLDKILNKSSKLVDRLHDNLIYKLFIKALADIYTEQIYAEVSLCNKIINENEKAVTISNINLQYLMNILNVYETVIPIFNIKVILLLKYTMNYKFYASTCGIFNFVNGWKRRFLGLTEKKNYPTYYAIDMETKENNTFFEFKFIGEKIRIFVTNMSNSPAKARVTIDNDSRLITVSKSKFNKFTNERSIQNVFESELVGNKIHYVKVEFLDVTEGLIFHGINIDKDGHAYHVDEVSNFTDLDVGKRIRYLYKGNKNSVGKFELATEKSNAEFLNILPSWIPNGEFYFIKVDKDKLFADRIIQNQISWKEISSKDIFTEEGYKIKLPTVGKSENDVENDWYKYIQKDKNSYLKWNLIEGYSSLGQETLETNQISLIGNFYYNNMLYGEDNHFWHSTTIENDTLPIGFRPILKINE